ncbi:MAG: hypothetical protein ACKO2L_17935 [Planctomycetaceae bacterium]
MSLWKFSGFRCGPFLVLGLLLLVAGCGGSETQALPLDEELARSSVQKALEAWQSGKKPADLSPEITIGDPAWNAGRQLKSFQILRDEETSDGSNLHIRVQRTFGDGGDKAESKTIYIVGTSPVITIFPR